MLLKKILTFFVVLYKALTHTHTHRCRYFPTCSQYALDALHYKPLRKALWLILCRIFSCHPWSKKPIVDILISEREMQ